LNAAGRAFEPADGLRFSVASAKSTSRARPGFTEASTRGHFDDFNALLDALQRGHPYAYQTVFDQYAGRVQAFAAARGAEDPAAVANDVMLVVFESSARFRGSESNFTSWVFRITRNKVVDDVRRQSRRPVSASDDRRLEAMTAVDADPANVRFEPDEVERILDYLSPAQREVVVLRVLTGLTNGEIAKVIGKREGAVRALYHRAMAELRDRLAS